MHTPKKGLPLVQPESIVQPQSLNQSSTSNSSKKRSVEAAIESEAGSMPKKNKKAVKSGPAKKKAPVTATPRANTRPTRARKAPARFDNEQQEPKKITSARVKKGGSKVFDPVYITTNANSRLVKSDIYHMLLEPGAWDSLSNESQKALIGMLPQDSSNIALLAKIAAGETSISRPEQLKGCDILRTDVAKFQEDLGNGFFGKTWQASAEQAVKDRAAGRFDDWKEQEMELWWGQKTSNI